MDYPTQQMMRNDNLPGMIGQSTDAYFQDRLQSAQKYSSLAPNSSVANPHEQSEQIDTRSAANLARENASTFTVGRNAVTSQAHASTESGKALISEYLTLHEKVRRSYLTMSCLAIMEAADVSEHKMVDTQFAQSVLLNRATKKCRNDDHASLRDRADGPCTMCEWDKLMRQQTGQQSDSVVNTFDIGVIKDFGGFDTLVDLKIAQCVAYGLNNTDLPSQPLPVPVLAPNADLQEFGPDAVEAFFYGTQVMHQLSTMEAVRVAKAQKWCAELAHLFQPYLEMTSFMGVDEDFTYFCQKGDTLEVASSPVWKQYCQCNYAQKFCTWPDCVDHLLSEIEKQSARPPGLESSISAVPTKTSHENYVYAQSCLQVVQMAQNRCSVHHSATMLASFVTENHNAGLLDIKRRRKGGSQKKTAGINENMEMLDFDTSPWKEEVAALDMHMLVPPLPSLSHRPKLYHPKDFELKWHIKTSCPDLLSSNKLPAAKYLFALNTIVQGSPLDALLYGFRFPSYLSCQLTQRLMAKSIEAPETMAPNPLDSCISQLNGFIESEMTEKYVDMNTVVGYYGVEMVRDLLKAIIFKKVSQMQINLPKNNPCPTDAILYAVQETLNTLELQHKMVIVQCELTDRKDNDSKAGTQFVAIAREKPNSLRHRDVLAAINSDKNRSNKQQFAEDLSGLCVVPLQKFVVNCAFPQTTTPGTSTKFNGLVNSDDYRKAIAREVQDLSDLLEGPYTAEDECCQKYNDSVNLLKSRFAYYSGRTARIEIFAVGSSTNPVHCLRAEMCRRFLGSREAAHGNCYNFMLRFPVAYEELVDKYVQFQSHDAVLESMTHCVQLLNKHAVDKSYAHCTKDLFDEAMTVENKFREHFELPSVNVATNEEPASTEARGDSQPDVHQGLLNAFECTEEGNLQQTLQLSDAVDAAATKLYQMNADQKERSAVEANEHLLGVMHRQGWCGTQSDSGRSNNANANCVKLGLVARDGHDSFLKKMEELKKLAAADEKEDESDTTSENVGGNDNGGNDGDGQDK